MGNEDRGPVSVVASACMSVLIACAVGANATRLTDSDGCVAYAATSDETVSEGLLTSVLHGDERESAEALIALAANDDATLGRLAALLSRLQDCEGTIDEDYLKAHAKHSRLPGELTRRHPNWPASKIPSILIVVSEYVAHSEPSSQRDHVRDTVLRIVATKMEDAPEVGLVSAAERAVFFHSSVCPDAGIAELLSLTDSTLERERREGPQLLPGIRTELKRVVFGYLALACATRDSRDEKIEKYRAFLGDDWADTTKEWFEYRARSGGGELFIDEDSYRSITALSPHQLVELYCTLRVGETIKRRIVSDLLVGDRDRLASNFALVRPLLLRDWPGGYSDILMTACTPIGPESSAEQMEIQDVLIDVVFGITEDYGVLGLDYVKNLMLHPDHTVREPYGRETVVAFLEAYRESCATSPGSLSLIDYLLNELRKSNGS